MDFEDWYPNWYLEKHEEKFETKHFTGWVYWEKWVSRIYDDLVEDMQYLLDCRD
jgi:hypothetical protein